MSLSCVILQISERTKYTMKLDFMRRWPAYSSGYDRDGGNLDKDEDDGTNNKQTGECSLQWFNRMKQMAENRWPKIFQNGPQEEREKEGISTTEILYFPIDWSEGFNARWL